MPNTLPRLTSTEGITDAYSKRILGNIIGADVLATLERSPKAIEKAMRGLTQEQLRRAPGRGKWSIAQIVNHLCDAELAVAFRLRMALAQSGSALQAWDENAWAAELDYQRSDARAKLGVYAALRSDTLSILRSIPKSYLERYGLHEERGTETVLRMAQLLAGHDVNHVKRIAEIRAIYLKKRPVK